MKPRPLKRSREPGSPRAASRRTRTFKSMPLLGTQTRGPASYRPPLLNLLPGPSYCTVKLTYTKLFAFSDTDFCCP